MKEKRAARHPLQPLVLDVHGVLRFKRNAIVDFLSQDKLNDLARMDFQKEDWEQFHQLIGYSHSGIPNICEESWQAALAVHETGVSELEGRYNHVRAELDALKKALRMPMARLFGIHPDDLEEGA